MFSYLPSLALLSILTVIVSGSPNPGTETRQAGTWDCSNQWISSVIKLGAPNGYCGRAVYRSDDIHKTGPSEYLVVLANMEANQGFHRSFRRIFDCDGKKFPIKLCCKSLSRERPPQNKELEYRITSQDMPANCVPHD